MSALVQPERALRDDQVLACDRIDAELDVHRSTLVVMSTGTGKTCVATETIRRRAHRGRALFLANRGELLKQAKATIEAWSGLPCGVEQADSWVSLDCLYPPHVVLASVQSLAGERQLKRLSRFPKDAFDLIVADEAHHSTAETWRGLLDYFPAAKIVGLTATPDRLDRQAMGLVFDSVAHRYDILDAIRDGNLVPIRAKAVEVKGLDLSKVKSVGGDLSAGQLGAELQRDANLHGVASKTVELNEGRRTLMFCATVEHAHEMARVLRGYGVTADAIDGSATEDERKDVLGRYRRGEIQVLTNCVLLGEGFDDPATSCVAVARMTKSRALFTQFVGRGTRLANGKSDLLVLDFRGNAGRHALVAPVDILGGDMEPAVRKRAEKNVAEGMPVHEAVEKAEIDERKAQEKKAAAARRRESARLQVAALADVLDVDPFAAVGIRRDDRVPETQARRAPSEQQISYLKTLGFPADAKAWQLDRRSASELIDELVQRRKIGMCSWREAAYLKEHGYSPDVPSRVAKSLIAKIKAGEQRTPGEDG